MVAWILFCTWRQVKAVCVGDIAATPDNRTTTAWGKTGSNEWQGIRKTGVGTERRRRPRTTYCATATSTFFYSSGLLDHVIFKCEWKNEINVLSSSGWDAFPCHKGCDAFQQSLRLRCLPKSPRLGYLRNSVSMCKPWMSSWLKFHAITQCNRHQCVLLYVFTLQTSMLPMCFAVWDIEY